MPEDRHFTECMDGFMDTLSLRRIIERMPLVVWKDRAVLIEDGNVMISARGRHDDFDFYKDDCPGRAVAIGFPGSSPFEVSVEGEVLRIRTTNGQFAVSNDNFHGDLESGPATMIEWELREKQESGNG